MRVKLGILLILICSLAWGQREDTVFDTPFQDLATDGVFSGAVRNIGQSSHLMVAILSNAPSQTCVTPAIVDIGMEYSYDNVVYIRANGPITRVTANEDGVLSSVQNLAGAFPYVRIAVRDFDTTTCRVTIKYSGAVAAFNVNNVATNNNFLGINAVSTLADNSGLNTQFTPSSPIVRDISASSSIEFARDVYDAFKLAHGLVLVM